jgi:hypothetical protein
MSTVRESVVNWLAELERALVTADGHAAANLFVPDGIWRDVLALTWDLHTYCGVQQIQEAMVAALGRTPVLGSSLDDGVPVRAVQRGGRRRSRQCSPSRPPSAAAGAWCAWPHR